MKRKHIGQRDCWCDPDIVHLDHRVIAPVGGRIVGVTELPDGRVVVHKERLPAAEGKAIAEDMVEKS